MANESGVKKGDWIRSKISLENTAEGGKSLFPGQVLKVGKDIDAGFANVLLMLPEDDPRAEIIDSDLAERLHAGQQAEIAGALTHANEIPPGEAEVREAERRRHLEQLDAEQRTQEADEQQESVHFFSNAKPSGEIQFPEGMSDEEKEAFLGEWRDAQKMPTDQEGDVDDNKQPEKVERATSPAAEQRETATPKRQRARVKPPKDKDDDAEDEDDGP